MAPALGMRQAWPPHVDHREDVGRVRASGGYAVTRVRCNAVDRNTGVW